MRHLNLILLLTGAIFLFFSCSKDNSTLLPDQPQGDQKTPAYKAQEITDFTGICTAIMPFPNPAGNYWLDDASDDRVSGVSLWVTEGADGEKFWGTSELFVGAEEIDGDYDGKWETKWYGTQTAISPTEVHIEALVVGTGTEGNVKGMFAEWTYEMTFNPSTMEGFFYTVEGYLAPKQLTNTLKFQKASGTLEIQPPGHPDNDCGDDILRLCISGGGNCTHLGLLTVENEVCFYFDDAMNIVPVSDWLGYLTAANGDMIYTQLVYSWEMDGMSYNLYVILDGTGRFEGATGYVENQGMIHFDPVNPLIGTWELEGEGIIVH